MSENVGMRHILFLDFDGVLHPFPAPIDPACLFCFLPGFEDTLRDLPHLEIVISSSWREGHQLDELRKLFSPDVGERIIGVTPQIDVHRLEDLRAVRQREIVLFLAKQPQEVAWIALDDDPDLFEPGCPNLIECIHGFGAAEENLLRKRYALNHKLF